MRSDERRRHVRIRPLPELPAKLVRLDGGAETPLEVYDVSIGGVGLVTDARLRDLTRDARIPLRIDLARYGSFELVGSIRHVGDTLTGCEVVELPPAYVQAMGRFIAELLERGAPS